MHSVRLRETISEFLEQAAAALQGALKAGAEVPFELDVGGGGRGPALYCYRPLTGQFIAERMQMLERLPAHEPAARALAAFEGLDAYLAGAGAEGEATRPSARVRAGLRLLLDEAFAEQSDFLLRPERARAALDRLERAADGSGTETTLVATLHGLTIISGELTLTRGLRIARPEALEGLPEGARVEAADGAPEHLVAVLSIEDEDPRRAVRDGRAVLKDLLRSLRLFGDGRVNFGALAWARTAGGSWSPLVLGGGGGQPRGILLVTPEQEDELRAFCNLVSRRAPAGNALAWALTRFELGCERASTHEALSDHLLALRALLEPEGPGSAMLPGRLAALCATPDQRATLAERARQAIALERDVIAGNAVEHAGSEAIANDVADHLRALLRDVICGHLDEDLAGLADELLLERETPAAPAPSPEQVSGDLGEPQEVLDLSV